MTKDIKNFKKYREKMNKIILDVDDKNIKRFFALDNRIYENGALDKKQRISWASPPSTVLRCNDCTLYHLDQIYQEKVTD